MSAASASQEASFYDSDDDEDVISDNDLHQEGELPANRSINEDLMLRIPNLPRPPAASKSYFQWTETSLHSLMKLCSHHKVLKKSGDLLV